MIGAAMARPTSPHRRLLAVLGALLAAAATAAGCTRPQPTRSVAIPGGGSGLPATVAHVVDGDTVDLRVGGGPGAEVERARLLGIDTPETVKPDTPVECFGPEASARTKELLPPGTDVVVQRDREARDRFGRLLLYVWRQQDGLFINRSLVADGYARTLSIEPNTAHRADLTAVLGTARATKAGLWGTCPPAG
jgi:micrococcal nuclease